MAYGAQFLNGRNVLILGEGIEPYVVASISDVPVWIGQGSYNEHGQLNGVKVGDIALPTIDSLMFFPWNDSCRGGAEGATLNSFYVHTDQPSVRVVIATPLKHVGGWQTYNGNYGLQINNAAGQRVYDSRVPIMQITARHMVRSVGRGQGTNFDSRGANYVCQSVSDIGIVNRIWSDGFLRRNGPNAAIMQSAWTENISDWIGNYPSNRAPNSNSTLIFANVAI